MNPSSNSSIRRRTGLGVLLLGVSILSAVALFAFRPPEPEYEYEKGSPGAPTLLVDALHHEAELPAYRTVKVETMPDGTIVTATKNMKKLPSGVFLKRLVLDYVGTVKATGKIRTMSQVSRWNEAGHWMLFPGAAVHVPSSEFEQIAGTLPTLGKTPEMAPRYLMRPGTWNGKACTIVIRLEAPAALVAIRQMMEKLHAQLPDDPDDPNRQARKFDPENYVTARTEFFIDPTLNFVVRRQRIAMNGKTMSDEGYQGVDIAPPLEADLFSIPSDAQVHFPKDNTEYRALVAKYAGIYRNVQKPQQNQTNESSK